MILLKIQNLILIDKAEIPFGPGLNIITGETGSGKSAILSAIRLISGERADTSLIRKGQDFAIVEAVFEGPTYIRREIHKSGKNRCFIDDQQVSLSDLKAKANIEMLDQNSSHLIFSSQMQMLDTFAGLLDKAAELEKSLQLEKEQEALLKELLKTPKERELLWAEKDLQMMEEIDWKNKEDEKLLEEHHLLTNAQETAQKLSSVAFALSEGTELPSLKRVLLALEQSARIDSSLKPIAESMKSALLELDEIGANVQTHAEKLQVSPARLIEVEKKMAILDSLKRRFGSEIQKEKLALETKIEHLNSLDVQIADLTEALKIQKEENQKTTLELYTQRKKAAEKLSPLVLKELKDLNLPHAQFEISLGENPKQIEFLFSANPGHAPLSLEKCASGGELSRLLLGLTTILSIKGSSLVFDEIDSNVGGHTATVLGQKLKSLAEKRQVICVTHFVQVAKCANHHFLVTKLAKEENVLTLISKLNEATKQNEYQRMLGKT